MIQTITLNVRYDWPESDWDKIMTVLAEMDGWRGGAELPTWFGGEGDAEYLLASVEPSGLVIEGPLDADLWIAWITKLCAKLTLALGRLVHDACI